jgi:hypothetical protein
LPPTSAGASQPTTPSASSPSSTAAPRCGEPKRCGSSSHARPPSCRIPRTLPSSAPAAPLPSSVARPARQQRQQQMSRGVLLHGELLPRRVRLIEPRRQSNRQLDRASAWDSPPSKPESLHLRTVVEPECSGCLALAGSPGRRQVTRGGPPSCTRGRESAARARAAPRSPPRASSKPLRLRAMRRTPSSPQKGTTSSRRQVPPRAPLADPRKRGDHRSRR